MSKSELINLDGRRVLLGVSGGIAAYKIVALTSMLTQSKAEVEVIMTRSAMKLIGPTSFQGFTGRAVKTKLFTEQENVKSTHISLGQWAEIFLIAPATANTIGALAGGLANNLLTCSALAVTCPILAAPAMNAAMWNNRIVQDNVKKLKGYGFIILEPGDGHLACGDIGSGRMMEPDEIYQNIVKTLNQIKK
jgi:phosphopantothenoylcysteine decarboxylase/phosphopantothenate--cysteine ligase